MSGRRLLVPVLVGAAVALIATPSGAAPTNGASPTLVNSGWRGFSWDEGGTAGPFTVTTETTTYLIVVDSYCRGDQFSVSDNGSVIGETSSVPVDPECDDVPFRDGPVESFLDPTYSSAEFTLGPGTHTITLDVIVNPFAGGGAFIGFGFTPRGS